MAELIEFVPPASSGLATLNLSNGTPYIVEIGRQGLHGARFTLNTLRVPMQPEERLREVQVASRLVDLPILIQAANRNAFLTAHRAITKAMNPLLGEGKLRVTSNDGVVRFLECRYVAGLEGMDSAGKANEEWMMSTISFRALNPFWQGVLVEDAYVVGGSTGEFFKNPFFPMVLTSSAVIDQPLVNNAGDVRAWPVFTITGPGENIALLNETTGKMILLYGLILDTGETLIIDTRPGYKSLTMSNGENAWETFTDESELWSLEPGDNQLSIQVNAADGNTEIAMSFTPQYLGI